MNKLRRLLCKSNQVPIIPVTTAAPTANLTQVVNPVYMILQTRPLVDYGLRELAATTPQHAMTEVAIISYLMGMGFEFRTARAIAESWEENETFFGECERHRPAWLRSITDEIEQK